MPSNGNKLYIYLILWIWCLNIVSSYSLFIKNTFTYNFNQLRCQTIKIVIPSKGNKNTPNYAQVMEKDKVNRNIKNRLYFDTVPYYFVNKSTANYLHWNDKQMKNNFLSDKVTDMLDQKRLFHVIGAVTYPR